MEGGVSQGDEREALEAFGAEVAAIQDEALEARSDLQAVRSRLLRPPEPRSTRRWALVGAGLAGAAVAIAFLVGRPLGDPGPRPLAFTLPGGAPGDSGAFVRAERSEHIAFGDGSALELAEGSDLRFTEVDAHGARLDLQRGRIRLDVVHRDSATRWSVRAGPFVVEVVGTRFEVGWDPVTGDFLLEMEEGRVELAGPGTERRSVSRGELVALNAYERPFEVGELAFPAVAGADPGDLQGVDPEADRALAMHDASGGARAAEAPDEPEALAGPQEGHRRRAGLDWRRLAREGRHREAVDAADWDRLLATGSAEALIQLGEAARFAGQAPRAAAAFQALRVRFPQAPQAPQAAFYLGRVAQGRGQHRAAADHFAVALVEAPSGPYAAAAAGRRIEALQRAGEGAAARQAAADYLERWPEGAHAEVARRVARLAEAPAFPGAVAR